MLVLVMVRTVLVGGVPRMDVLTREGCADHRLASSLCVFSWSVIASRPRIPVSNTAFQGFAGSRTDKPGFATRNSISS